MLPLRTYLFFRLHPSHNAHLLASSHTVIAGTRSQVSGVGVVVSGLVKNGALAMNQRMLLGPCPDGSFRAVLLKSLHLKRLPVDAARMGDSVSISVRECVCVRAWQRLTKTVHLYAR